MNIELEEKLQKHLNQDDLTSCISLIEKELSSYQDTDFYKIIGRNLLHQTKSLKEYFDRFMETVSSGTLTKVIYAEINGFSINYDLWYVDFFGFDSVGDMEDLDWLADWEEGNESEIPFMIKGFESIQNAYEKYHENKFWKNQHIKEAAELCELAVIIKLQELFKKAVEVGKSEKTSWANLPILVTAHDYDLIYRKK